MTLYIAGSAREAEWLREDLGLRCVGDVVVAGETRSVEGRRLHEVKSTRLARMHPHFEATLMIALASLQKTRKPSDVEADFGLRSHRHEYTSPPWLYN